MNKKFIKNKVYHTTKLDDLENMCNKNFNYINFILYYLLILEKYDKMYGIIVDKLKKLKTEKKKEKLNYYAWFYFYYNNETYNADGVYARLSEKNKIKIDIFKCENLEEEMEIFDKRFVPFLNSRKIFCDFGNLVYILYLSNLLRKESVTSKKIQIELNIKIMSILIFHYL